MEALFDSDNDLTVESTTSCNKLRKSKASLLDRVSFGVSTQFSSMQYMLVVKKESFDVKQ
tara:strand:+ start:1868 stop:2047 length:180 start_codon:yes stop_codon:yes gene_type:complete